MRISLTDLDLVPELLAYLRRRGCIAYATGETQVIEVLGPDGLNSDEPFEVRALVGAWLTANPTATLRIEPHGER
jgi:hypothetical protein